MNIIRLMGIFTIVLMLGGCIQYTLVPVGEVSVKSIKTSTGMSWNKSPFNFGPKTTVWTADGESLDQIIFIHDIANGETLFKNASKDVVMPHFSDAMLLHEIEDLLITSLTNLYNGQITVESSNLRPTQFSDKNGIQFDLKYYSIDGLAIKGKAKAAVNDGKFYAIVYTAADLHYYGKYEAEVDAILNAASIEI